MKRKFIAILMIMCLGAGLAGCSSDKNEISTNITASKIAVSSGDRESVGEADTYIKLGSSIEVKGNGVVVDNNKVTINSGGTYSISGEISDGQIIVNASKEEKVSIILNGVNITCSNSSPIYVKQCKKAVISLAKGSENIINDGTEYVFADLENEEPNAAIFSKDDLIFIGEGSLTVNANFNNGITSKDDLKIEGGNINVNSKSDGVRGKDSITITDGNITINSGQDGMKSNNANDADKGYVLIEGGIININSQEDAIQAESNLYVRDGEVTLSTRGGSAANTTVKTEERPMMGIQLQSETSSTEEKISSKGLKAVNNIIIEGGNFNIDSYDDAIHSNNLVNIVNGTFNIASGDDAVHADSECIIDNGTINITKSYEGIEAETITINDGEINLVSSDDGINAGGSDSQTGGNMGGAPQNKMNNPQERTTGMGPDSENIDPKSNNIQNPERNEKPNVSQNLGQSENAGEPGFPQINEKGGMGEPMQSSGTGVININGGKIVINAEGDGIDSNGSVYMNGGLVIVNGPVNNGNGALDYDNDFTVIGGTLIAAGSSGMAQNVGTTTTQNSVKVTLSSQDAGKIIHIEDENGNEIVTFAPEKKYSSFIISSDALKTGSSYKVYVGGSAEGEEYNGLYSNSKYTKGEEVVSFTVSETVTSVAQEGVETSSGGMGGGGRGQRGQGAGQNPMMNQQQ